MANLKEIVYLTPTQFNTLVTTGSLTVGGVTYNYDDNNDYRVKYVPVTPLPENTFTCEMDDGTTKTLTINGTLV